MVRPNISFSISIAFFVFILFFGLLFLFDDTADANHEFLCDVNYYNGSVCGANPGPQLIPTCLANNNEGCEEGSFLGGQFNRRLIQNCVVSISFCGSHYSYGQGAYYTYGQVTYYTYAQSTYPYTYGQVTYYTYAQSTYPGYTYGQSVYIGPSVVGSATPGSGTAPLNFVDIAITSSNFDPLTPITFRVDCTNSGSWDNFVTVAAGVSNATFANQCNYAAAGTYTVRVRGEQLFGASAEDTFTISVGAAGYSYGQVTYYTYAQSTYPGYTYGQSTYVGYSYGQSTYVYSYGQSAYGPSTILRLPSPITFGSLEELLEGIINWLLVITGPLIVLLIVYAGFMHVVGSFSPEMIRTARRIITYALIGYAVILLAKVFLGVVTGIFA